MGWITAVIQFFKIIGFFLNLKSESNKKKAEEKAEIGKDIVNALAETDKNKRASRLNGAVGSINRVS